MDPTLLREAATLAESGEPCALAVVAAAKGSVPGKVGATMLVTRDATRGTVGGAGLEERVKALARDALRTGEGGVHVFDLARWKEGGLDSVCGGTVTIAISVVRPAPHLLLVGGGHCSEALARLCDVLGWSYSIVDSRAGYAEESRFPTARAAATQAPAAFIRQQDDLARFSHVYVMGHSHHEDGDAILALLERGYAGHLGVIGSKSKLHAFRERAQAAGLGAEFARVRSPIGLDVGAEPPAEIAVSVAAELISLARRAPAPSLSPQERVSR